MQQMNNNCLFEMFNSVYFYKMWLWIKKNRKNPSKRCTQLIIRPAPALQKLFTQTVQKVLNKTAEFVFTLCPDKSPFIRRLDCTLL